MMWSLGIERLALATLMPLAYNLYLSALDSFVITTVLGGGGSPIYTPLLMRELPGTWRFLSYLSCVLYAMLNNRLVLGFAQPQYPLSHYHIEGSNYCRIGEGRWFVRRRYCYSFYFSRSYILLGIVIHVVPS